MAKEKILNIFNYFYALAFSVIFLIFITAKLKICNNFIKFGSVIATIAIIILFITASWFFEKKLQKTLNLKLIFIAALLLLLAIQIFLAISLDFVPVTDAYYLDVIARNYTTLGTDSLYEGLSEIHDHYLARYENQWGIFIILSSYYKLLYAVLGFIPVHASEVLNIIAIDLSILITFFISCEIFDKSYQKSALLIALVFHPVIYVYTCYFYTDTISMPFSLLAALSLIKFLKSNNRRDFWVWLSVCALSVGFGFAVKGSVGIILVAAVILSFSKLKFKKCLAATAVITAATVAVVTLNSLIISASGIVTKEETEKYKFPVSHWIMMGLNGRGGYDHDDFLYTYSFETYDEKSTADKAVITERISEMGLNGTVKHIIKKIEYTWTNAMYLTTHIMSNSPDSSIKRFFCESKIFHDYCFSVQTIILFLSLCSCIKGCVKRRTDGISYITLIVFGLILFLILWETRSRYTVNFLPLLLLIAVDGLDGLCGFILFIKRCITTNLMHKA